MRRTALPMSKVVPGSIRPRRPERWEYRGSARHSWVPRVQTEPDLVLTDIYRSSRRGLAFWNFLETVHGLGRRHTGHWLFAVKAPTGLWMVSHAVFPSSQLRNGTFLGSVVFIFSPALSLIHVRAGISSEKTAGHRSEGSALGHIARTKTQI